MPTTSIPIGPAITILQNITYALPAKKVRVTSSLAVQTSMDGSTWTALTNAETTGAETGATFLRCAVGNAIVTCTAAGDQPASWNAGAVNVSNYIALGNNPPASGGIRLTHVANGGIKYKLSSNQLDYNLIAPSVGNNNIDIGQGGLQITSVSTHFFSAGINVTGTVVLNETTEPGATVNQAKLYAIDVAGKTALFVKFGSGAPIQLAIEP